MSSVAYPTVLVGVGRFGREVLERAWAGLDQAPGLLERIAAEPAGVRAALEPVLEELLRAGRASGERREPRLDLVLFVSALQLAEGELLRLCDDLSALVGERYAAMFPADRPPEQRTAALHLVVAAPRLTSPPGANALNELAKVEAWARGRPAYPLLARIWLVSQQTTAGTLTVEELERACAGFAAALCASGLRAEDVVARRLTHPPAGEGLVGFFATATVDLPAQALRRYAVARAELDGLETLLERVSRPVPDPAAALTAIAPLRAESWLTALEEGEGARRVRALAAELSGGGKQLPAVSVAPFDRDEDIRAKHGALFAPGSVDRPLTSEDQAKLAEVLAALDKAEADAASDVRRGLDAVLTGPLAPQTGLARLPEVEHGLRRAAAALRDQQAADEARQAEVERDLQPSPVDPHRAELEQALAGLPSRSRLVAFGLAVAGALAFLVAMIGLRVGTPAPAPGAPLPAVPLAAQAPAATGAELAPWLAGLLLGALVGYGCAWLVGDRSRAAVREALQRRRDALAALWSKGGGGPPQRQAEMQLILRRRRVRRGAIAQLEGALERLVAARRTVGEARDRARDTLRSLQVGLGPEAVADDLSGLVGQGGELHGPLVPPALVARWVARCREVAEPAVWADRLLEGTWPPGGLAEDAPCADAARLDELAERMVRPLSERSIFESDEASVAAAQGLAERARRAGAVLAPPVEPKNELGDRVSQAVEARFAVAPVAGRQALEVPLRSVGARSEVLWTSARAPRVLFLATWEGYTVEQVLRGAGLALGPGGARRGVGG